MTVLNRPRQFVVRASQRGAATLIVCLAILIILTIIILASSNVALFEQKTTVNENREQLANQASEYALNLAGEYLKANIVNMASNEDANGWLSAGANLHWQLCPDTPTDANHPCMAENDPGRRSNLYYWVSDGVAVTDASSATLDLPHNDATLMPTGARLTSIGGAAAFTPTTRVHALLCRLDTTAGAQPTCQATPSNGNRVAITLVAETSINGENAASQIKETWGTFNSFSAQAAVPLVASGLVTGLGNATIVAAPNAGGYGVEASIWSPRDVDVDESGGGVGSVQTCHLGDYLQDTPVSELETTCVTVNNACGCEVEYGSSDFLSGHPPGKNANEGRDVLDIDGNAGTLPDIQFFPGKKADGTCLDSATDNIDDNLFEWIFAVDVNAASTCATNAVLATENTALDDLGATVVADCSGINATSSGLFRVTGSCNPGPTLGSKDAPVVVVVDNDMNLTGNSVIYGMVFVRDTSGAGSAASMHGAGSVTVFGSVVVEGNVAINGGIDIVYVDTSAGSPGKKLPATTRFARLPGSWLDSRTGF